MKSRWFELKSRAIQLRKRGRSIREIEKTLSIPRSTLSGWLKDIKLTEEQISKLRADWVSGLVTARKKAVLWHNKQKELRLKEAEDAALKLLSNIDTKNKDLIELALAMLYLGEGGKTNDETVMGSSNPLILKFFIKVLKDYYHVNPSKITCSLHLRSDQNPELLKQYWSQELDIPTINFKATSIDKRTIKSPTYSHYHGVCVIRCGNIALQRKLILLSNVFCEKVINTNFDE